MLVREENNLSVCSPPKAKEDCTTFAFFDLLLGFFTLINGSIYVHFKNIYFG